MIFNNGQIYGKVWKVTPSESGKYIDLQMSTSEKDASGEYRNSSWYPRVIGHALNSLKGIKDGDRILITKSKFTNERYADANGVKKYSFRFIILEAKILDESGDSSTVSTNTEPRNPTASQVLAQNEDETDPW